ncbi:hypothetical protein [Propionispora hippei]|uniref:Uncharacterized protein n=1 Tax=Propionispora hippei DSM 15287 TaxID=1123003 RepID=A0A1M6D0M0_9FIRM|nr:hypothetical protein [Propionispora hippei]SHI66661.1 hypothetical protein SAMN02745170_00800 [Propionispora hippei DSM 15287]
MLKVVFMLQYYFLYPLTVVMVPSIGKKLSEERRRTIPNDELPFSTMLV